MISNEQAEGQRINSAYKMHKIRRIQTNVFYILDQIEASFYVVIGETTTAVIDTGMAVGEKIFPLVRELAGNDNPIILILTHSHYDHCHHMSEFETVYLCHKELALFSNSEMIPGVDASEVFIKTLDMDTGTAFDLGGETLEILHVPGHTPGSVVVYAKSANLVFTGDAIGSGYGPSMFAKDMSLPLGDYCKSLLALQKWLIARGGRMKFWGGHQLQQFQSKLIPGYNPVNMGYLGDLIDLVDKVATGEIVGRESDFPHVFFFESMHYASYGRAELTYMQSNI